MVGKILLVARFTENVTAVGVARVAPRRRHTFLEALNEATISECTFGVLSVPSRSTVRAL